MPIDPALARPRITPEVLAEFRRTRITRRRWLILFLIGICLAPGYLCWVGTRQFLAASWLEANQLSVDWQIDGRNWLLGGVTSVRAHSIYSFGSAYTEKVELHHLTALHRVEDLDLQGFDGLRDSDLACLGQLTELRTLNLDQPHDRFSRRPGPAGITDATLARIAGLRHLNDLSLGGGRFTDAGMAHISGLADLGSLDLSDTGITAAGLEPLRGLKRLKSLVLSGTRVTAEGVQAIQVAIPGLQVTTDPPGPTLR